MSSDFRGWGDSLGGEDCNICNRRTKYNKYTKKYQCSHSSCIGGKVHPLKTLIGWACVAYGIAFYGGLYLIYHALSNWNGGYGDILGTFLLGVVSSLIGSVIFFMTTDEFSLHGSWMRRQVFFWAVPIVRLIRR